MDETAEESEDVILQIGDETIKCNKQQLIDNSDYFKIMFGGNFVEHTKKVIDIKGVDIKTMKLLLLLLWDKSITIDEKDFPAILEASSMFQFLEIKDMFIQRFLTWLNPKNCIQTWLIAEKLGIKTLYLKAKTMALIEFDSIKHLDVLKDLDLHQLYVYLANTSLHCNGEMQVFDLCIKWWYHNSQKLLQESTLEQRETITNDTFLYLLSCLDFKKLTDCDIKRIIVHSDITENIKIINLLNCVLSLRHNDDVETNSTLLRKAEVLLNSNSRYLKLCPCILVKKLITDGSTTQIEKDMYKRKRHCVNIAEQENSSLVVLYFDCKKNSFNKFGDVNDPSCTNLDGFRLLGHKQFIFLLGGEYMAVSKYNWNEFIWVFDTVREHWINKTTIPSFRRHFQCCVCGDYLYIIGGTGKFRVVKDNMFWYNYRTNEWSKEILLPSYRQIKSCCFNNQVLILDLNGSCGYLFDQATGAWEKLNIIDNQQLMPNFPKKYVVYTYKGYIYIRGEHLIKLQKVDNSLQIVECKASNFLSCDEVESVLCNDVVYLLYLHRCSEIGTYGISLEKYFIESEISEFIFKDVTDGTALKVDNQEYFYRMSSTIFEYFHYSLSNDDDFVNNISMII